jgi:2-keto-myo-inositol isomerase
MKRRQLLQKAGIVTAGMTALPLTLPGSPATQTQNPQFSYCLNTSTIRGQKPGLIESIEVAAEAGYDGVEIWVRSLDEYLQQGGTASDLRKRVADLGLSIENAIAFPAWLSDDEAQRLSALEQARREMDLLARIGCTRVAAPPAGATQQPGLDLHRAAERYRALLETGKGFGVTPQLELWGFSANLSRLGEVAFVAVEADHPDACILPDVYHIYKGGSGYGGLELIDGRALRMFHMNDFPAEPPREKIADADRVYPGDGIAPIDRILRMLNNKGQPIVLSLELFNPSYWGEDALTVARTGLAKMKSAVERISGSPGAG